MCLCFFPYLTSSRRRYIGTVESKEFKVTKTAKSLCVHTDFLENWEDFKRTAGRSGRMDGNRKSGLICRGSPEGETSCRDRSLKFNIGNSRFMYSSRLGFLKRTP
jgi:hypothetical protein